MTRAGTGKTYAVQNWIEGCQFENRERQDWFVQFHPSYDYSDFVEGLRPVLLQAAGKENGMENMVFVRVDGIFKRFCRKVVQWNQENGMDETDETDYQYFLIDEINRADLSKVFGELMYCLEEGYRGETNRIATQYSNLPVYEKIQGGIYKKIDEKEDVYADGFYIPHNVVIIGIMNDIDRSVESFDFALRRRFDWMEVGGGLPADRDSDSYKSYRGYLKKSLASIFGMPELSAGQTNAESANLKKEFENLIDRITDLNQCIAEDTEGFGFDSSYCIGLAYFKELKSYFASETEDGGTLEELLASIWKNRISPLLREYSRGQRRAEDFIRQCREKLLLLEEKEKIDKK